MENEMNPNLKSNKIKEEEKKVGNTENSSDSSINDIISFIDIMSMSYERVIYLVSLVISISPILNHLFLFIIYIWKELII